MSNPASQLPPEYDDIQPRGYDPAFTADISSKMRIPDRIAVANSYPEDRTVDSLNRENLARDDLHRSATMNVPDKIMLYDADKDDNTPDLHADLITQSMKGYKHVDLSTPPRVIRVDERPFRYTDDERTEVEADDRTVTSLDPNGGYASRTISEGLEEDALRVSPGQPLLIADDDEDELSAIRKKVDKLTLHVYRLEEENSKRKQHELVLSSVVIGYVMVQIAKWLLSGK